MPCIFFVDNFAFIRFGLLKILFFKCIRFLIFLFIHMHSWKIICIMDKFGMKNQWKGHYLGLVNRYWYCQSQKTMILIRLATDPPDQQKTVHWNCMPDILVLFVLISPLLAYICHAREICSTSFWFYFKDIIGIRYVLCYTNWTLLVVEPMGCYFQAIPRFNQLSVK